MNNPDPQIMAQLYQMFQNGQIQLNNMNNMNPFGNNNSGTAFIPANNQFGNNMFAGGMNPTMMNFAPNNLNFNNQSMNSMNSMNNMQNQAEDWTIIFETLPNKTKINVQISSADLVSNVFSKYRTKSMENDIPLKFSYKGKPLDPKLTISGSGLSNNAIITVEKINVPKPKPEPIPQDPNKWNLFFEKRGEEGTINIQVLPNQYVKDAIIAYKNKVNRDGNMIFIFNSKTLDENMSLKQAGITSGARIIVVETAEIIGAY